MIAALHPLGGRLLSFEAIDYFRFTAAKTCAGERGLHIFRSIMDFIYNWVTENNKYRMEAVRLDLKSINASYPFL
jgi:hypothetical protein